MFLLSFRWLHTLHFSNETALKKRNLLSLPIKINFMKTFPLNKILNSVPLREVLLGAVNDAHLWIRIYRQHTKTPTVCEEANPNRKMARYRPKNRGKTCHAREIFWCRDLATSWLLLSKQREIVRYKRLRLIHSSKQQLSAPAFLCCVLTGSHVTCKDPNVAYDK